MANLQINASLRIDKSLANIANDIKNKINPQIQADANARVKLVGGLDISKTVATIKANLQNVNKDLHIEVGKVAFAPVKTIQLQNSIDQAVKNIKPTVEVTPVINTQDFAFKSERVRKSIREISNTWDADVIERFSNAFKALGASISTVQKLDIVDGHMKSFVATVKSATGEVEKFEYKLNKDETSFELKNVTAADTAVQKMIQGMLQWQDKTKAVRINMMSDLKQIRTAWQDVNGGKSVQDEGNIQKLREQYVSTVGKIKELREANTETFASLKANVSESIDKLNSMVREYHNAEKVATSLRTKGAEVVKEDTLNNINKFEYSIRNSQVPIEAFIAKINEMRKALNALDEPGKSKADIASGLTSVLDSLDNAKTKFQSLKELFKGAGTVEWLKINKDQINSLDDLNAKIAIYKKVLDSLKTSWTPANGEQDVLKLSTAFGKLAGQVGTIKSQKAFDGWVAKIEKLINGSEKLNANLELEVSVQKEIYRVQAEIAKLNQNPQDNANQLARRQAELDNLLKQKSNLEFISNFYSKLVPLEQQEKYISQQTRVEREKLLDVEAKIADAKSKSTILAFDKANAEITSENLNKILNAYKEIWRLSKENLGANIGENMIAYNKEQINLLQEQIKLSTDELEKNGLLTNEIRNQIEAERDRTQIKIQALTADKETSRQAKLAEQQINEELKKETNYLKELDSLYSTILASEKKISAEKNNANKQSIRDNEIKNAEKRIAEIQQEVQGNEKLKQVINEKIIAEEAELAVQKKRIANREADKAEEQRIKQEAEDYKVLTQMVREYVTEIQKQLNVVNQFTQKSIKDSNANNQSVYQQEINNAKMIIQNRMSELESNGLLTNSIIKLVETRQHEIDVNAQLAQNNANTQRQKEITQTYEQQAKTIQNYSNTVERAITKLRGISNQPIFTANVNNSQIQNTKADVQKLITEYEKLKQSLKGNLTSDQLLQIKTRLDELDIELKKATSDVTNLKASFKSGKDAQKLAGDISILTAQIKKFRTQNSRSEGRFGAEYQELLNKLKQHPDTAGLYAIRQEFRKLQGDVRVAGLTGMTFFDTFKNNFRKMSSWLGVSSLGMLVGREIRQMFSDVVKLDEALFDLRKTFQGTDADLKEFYYTSNDIARQLGVTTEEVIKSASSWSRLGYNTKETAETMAKLASQFAVISPGMTVEKATDGLVSIMKAKFSCLNVQKCA